MDRSSHEVFTSAWPLYHRAPAFDVARGLAPGTEPRCGTWRVEGAFARPAAKDDLLFTELIKPAAIGKRNDPAAWCWLGRKACGSQRRRSDSVCISV